MNEGKWSGSVSAEAAASESTETEAKFNRQQETDLHPQQRRSSSDANAHKCSASPEQLRVDEGDDVLQQLVGGAYQEVRPEGFEERAQEGRLFGSFLIGQQHVGFLWTGLARLASWQVVGGRRGRFGVQRLARQILFAAGRGDVRKINLKFKKH